MSASIKNVTIGPATVSFGGADLGALKGQSVAITYDLEHTVLGNNENLPGPYAVYRKMVQAIVKVTTMETTLANIKTAIGDSASPTGVNPNVYALEYLEGMITPGALIVTGAAPRSSAGVAQTRTITIANAVPFKKQVVTGMGHDAPAEIELEFLALVNSSGTDISYSDVNA
jgi:hypothetical protein